MKKPRARSVLDQDAREARVGKAAAAFIKVIDRYCPVSKHKNKAMTTVDEARRQACLAIRFKE